MKPMAISLAVALSSLQSVSEWMMAIAVDGAKERLFVFRELNLTLNKNFCLLMEPVHQTVKNP
jgi:hypothetical protein